MIIPILATLVAIGAIYVTFFSSWAKSSKPKVYPPLEKTTEAPSVQAPAVRTSVFSGSKSFESARNKIRRLSIPDAFFLSSGITEDKEIKEVKAAFKEFLLIMTQLTPAQRSGFVHGNFQVGFLWEGFSASSAYRTLAQDLYGPGGLKYDESYLGDASDPYTVVACWVQHRELIETVLNSQPYTQTGKLFGEESFAYRELLKTLRRLRSEYLAKNSTTSQNVTVNRLGRTRPSAW